MRSTRPAGRTADALGAFHRLRRRLAADLGIDPAPELRQTYDAILRSDLKPARGRITRRPLRASA